MPPQHSRGNQFGNRRRLVASMLQRVQRVQANLLPCRCLRCVRLIPLRNPRIQIPAVVIDALAFGLQLCQQLPHIRQRLAFQMHQPHHHIRHLHAGVVNVVLHAGICFSCAQQAHKSIAQNRIAQVPDVRSLIWIDARVLNKIVGQVLFGEHITTPHKNAFVLRDDPRHRRRAVQLDVQVARARHFHRGHAVHARQLRL